MLSSSNLAISLYGIRSLTLTYKYTSKMFIQKYLPMGVRGKLLWELCLTLCCTSETNMMLTVNCNWKIRRKFKKGKKYLHKAVCNKSNSSIQLLLPKYLTITKIARNKAKLKPITVHPCNEILYTLKWIRKIGVYWWGKSLNT